MDNPETQATLVTRHRTKTSNTKNTTQKVKKKNKQKTRKTDPTKELVKDKQFPLFKKTINKTSVVNYK